MDVLVSLETEVFETAVGVSLQRMQAVIERVVRHVGVK